MMIEKLIRTGLVALFVLIARGNIAQAKEPSPSPTVLPALHLRVGQKYPIEGVLTQNALVSNEEIATAHQTPEGLLLVGRKPGSTTLSVEVSGKPAQLKLIVAESATANTTTAGATTSGQLQTLRGIRLSRLGQKTILQGEILSRKVYQNILLRLRDMQRDLIVLATPAAGIKDSLLEQAHSLLKSRGLIDVIVENAGNRFFLEGTVVEPNDVERALELVQSIIPNIENHLAIPLRVDPTISVRVFILELSRQAHQALGLSWPTSTQNAFAFTPKTSFFNPTWIMNMNHLSTTGQARILAEPLLAVKSGSRATLSAGGEIPIRITGRQENKVIWKHYGLKIDIGILGVAGRHIRTKIDTESSQLDEATAVDGVPGMRSTTMATEVDALAGQPILLTGLFQAEAAKDVDRVPLLGQIPLIGELFKSRRFRNRESELLVALLPTFGATPTSLPLGSRRGIEFDRRWGLLD